MYHKKSNSWVKHVDFIIIDLLCVQLAFYLSYVFRMNDLNPYIIRLYLNMAIYIEIADIFIIFITESFKNVLKRNYSKEFIAVLKQSIYLILLASFYLITVQDGNAYSRSALFMMCGLYILIAYIIRIIYKKYMISRMNNVGDTSLIIVTTSKIADEVVLRVKTNNFDMYQVNGLIIVDEDIVGESIQGVSVVANIDNASQFLRQCWVDEVFVILDQDAEYPKELIERCNEMGITVHLNLARVSDMEVGKQSVSKVGGYTVLTTSINYMTTKQVFIKRLMDICFGLVGCFITVIIFIFIAPIIYINSPGPIFFAQERVGQNGKTFKMYKFRSMYMDAEERKQELMKQNKMSNNLMFKLDFDPRIIGNKILADGTKKTGIGQFIRSTSLDEFPQFWNVLNGTMSVVGFRPALVSEYSEYDYHHRARIAMKPGITGMWQVSGRSDITDFEDVVKLDTDYIKNWTVSSDIKIILKTITAVLKREGSM